MVSQIGETCRQKYQRSGQDLRTWLQTDEDATCVLILLGSNQSEKRGGGGTALAAANLKFGAEGNLLMTPKSQRQPVTQAAFNENFGHLNN